MRRLRSGSMLDSCSWTTSITCVRILHLKITNKSPGILWDKPGIKCLNNNQDRFKAWSFNEFRGDIARITRASTATALNIRRYPFLVWHLAGNTTVSLPFSEHNREKDWATEEKVLDKREVASFEFKISAGISIMVYISYIPYDGYAARKVLVNSTA